MFVSAPSLLPLKLEGPALWKDNGQLLLNIPFLFWFCCSSGGTTVGIWPPSLRCSPSLLLLLQTVLTACWYTLDGRCSAGWQGVKSTPLSLLFSVMFPQTLGVGAWSPSSKSSLVVPVGWFLCCYECKLLFWPYFYFLVFFSLFPFLKWEYQPVCSYI